MKTQLPTMSEIGHDGRVWATARIVEGRDAKRYINRLDVMGFEYCVQQENRHLRILVPHDQLEEILGWFGDLGQAKPQEKNSFDKLNILLLMLIPGGMFAGSLFARLTGIGGAYSIMLSAFGGVMAVGVAAIIFARVNTSLKN
ncbi:MAG: hypothetical protein AB8B55_21475 [Mariniblastus sp.]